MSNLDNVICVRSKNESKLKSKKSNETKTTGETKNESNLESKKVNDSTYNGDVRNESKLKSKKGKVC